MNFKDMKNLLLNYPAMTEKVYGIEKEISMARAEIQAIREGVSTTLDGMPRGNATSDPTYRKAEKIIDKFEKRIRKLLDDKSQIMDEQQKLTDLLRKLNPDEHKVIKARYLDDIRWDFVPAKVNFDRSHCFRLHDRAINKMINNFKT